MLTKDAEDDSVSSDPELQAGWLSLVRVVVEAGDWGLVMLSSNERPVLVGTVDQSEASIV